MVEMKLVYEGGLHTQSSHGPSGATLETDAPVDNQGKGEAFSPTDLLATSLAPARIVHNRTNAGAERAGSSKARVRESRSIWRSSRVGGLDEWL